MNSFGLGNYAILAFALYFAALHMLNFITMPKKRALYYTIFSFFGSMIFYALITYLDVGVYISFAVHYIFYLGIAIATYYNNTSEFNAKHIGPKARN
jgi:hypothetical protein